mmetsp:Transcript_149102/g.371447  ORF Transcript_149102/g.371447 Transcript_149102/m.371447 type:complete len:223 (+) Transcript_149102:196-864(+)
MAAYEPARRLGSCIGVAAEDGVKSQREAAADLLHQCVGVVLKLLVATVSEVTEPGPLLVAAQGLLHGSCLMFCQGSERKNQKRLAIGGDLRQQRRQGRGRAGADRLLLGLGAHPRDVGKCTSAPLSSLDGFSLEHVDQQRHDSDSLFGVLHGPSCHVHQRSSCILFCHDVIGLQHLCQVLDSSTLGELLLHLRPTPGQVHDAQCSFSDLVLEHCQHRCSSSR